MIIDNEETVRFGQFFDTECRRRYVRAHNTIQNSIGEHLQSEGFEVVYEWKDEDEDSSYRYDIIAQKKKELWVIEVKDVLDIRNFGQVYAYILQVKKENPTAKVWLGTDCKNYWDLIEGEIGQMTENLMKKEKLGIILINPKLVWILPTHNDLLNIQERGHLCEDCRYCDGFLINGAAYKFLAAIEEGKKTAKKITKADKETDYEFLPEEFKDILKEFRKIKNKMGKNKFESVTGMKLE
ncbi:MAG: hypothetical protein WC916_01180 [Candidatus Woesearchaeota archaeon]